MNTDRCSVFLDLIFIYLVELLTLIDLEKEVIIYKQGFPKIKSIAENYEILDNIVEFFQKNFATISSVLMYLRSSNYICQSFFIVFRNICHIITYMMVGPLSMAWSSLWSTKRRYQIQFDEEISVKLDALNGCLLLWPHILHPAKSTCPIRGQDAAMRLLRRWVWILFSCIFSPQFNQLEATLPFQPPVSTLHCLTLWESFA